MSDPTLKPCPFCGSQCFFNHEDATDPYGKEYVRAWVECTGCDMRSIAKRAAYGIPAVKVTLAELWNRRVTTTQAEAKVADDVVRDAVPASWIEAARKAKMITADVCRAYPETAAAHINGLANLLLAAKAKGGGG